MELNRARPRDQVMLISMFNRPRFKTHLCFIWTGRYWSSNPHDFTSQFFTSEILVTSCRGSVMITQDKAHAELILVPGPWSQLSGGPHLQYSRDGQQ